MKIDIWFPAIMTIVGVVIGGLLTPFTSNKIEEVKRKRIIKPKLVSLIHQLYNLRTQEVSIFNHLELFGLGITSTTFQLAEAKLVGEPRKEIERQNTSFTILYKDYSVKKDETYNKILMIESEILSVISEARAYYSKQIYNELVSQIQEPIIKLYLPTKVYDYQTLNNEQFLIAHRDLPVKLLQLAKETLKEKDIITSRLSILD